GLFITTLVVLVRLGYRTQQERRLHQKITYGLRAIKSEYRSDLRHGLPQAAYDAIVQLFDTTPFVPFWEGVTAQMIVRPDARGMDRFGSRQVLRLYLMRYPCLNRVSIGIFSQLCRAW